MPSELLTFQDEDGCDKRPSDAPFDDLHQVIQSRVTHVGLRMSAHSAAHSCKALIAPIGLSLLEACTAERALILLK
jgi:hypothetical protein